MGDTTGVIASIVPPDDREIRMMQLKVLADTEASRGDGGTWTFDASTCQTDIRPWELMQILGFALTIPDGMRQNLGHDMTPHQRNSIMRHFRYDPPKETT